MIRTGLGVAVALLLLPAAGAAQDLRFRGYALNVLVGSGDSPFAEAGVQDVQRLRLMLHPTAGPATLDLGYEQVLTLSSTDVTGGTGLPLGAPSRGDWLPFQGTIASGDHATWHHRLDRANVALQSDRIEGIVGRQTISWGTTLFLTPADPFAPFDPADPFRDYRVGVDAVRARVFPSALSEIESVLRLASYDDSTTVTALGRGRFAVGGADLTLWGGLVHDAAAGAVGVTVIVLDAALRSEVSVRDDTGRVVFRGAVGADRSFTVAARTLYAVIEYQYDGFGAASADDLITVLSSAPYRRAEMQVLGRHEVAAQASYEAHPLVQLGALALWNAGDGSVLLSPSLGWSAGRELTVSSGVFLGLGPDRTPAGLPASEYGTVPPTVYAAGTLFF